MDFLLYNRPAMENEIFNDDIYMNITDFLLACQIKPNVAGFGYLRVAIRLCIEDGELIAKVTKKLYPAVAEVCGVSSGTVERGIRTAIEQAYNRGGLLEMNKLGGAIIYKNDYKLSNSEMISTVAELIIMKRNRQNYKEKIG